VGLAGNASSSVTEGLKTTDFLEWLCEQVQMEGKHMLVLIWDNASQAG
jgi:hypothetical protein